jgi:hypothetical protein
MQTVTLGRNLGEQVEVLTGLTDGQRLVLNPPDALKEGDVVNFNPDAPKTDAKDKPAAAKDKP